MFNESNDSSATVDDDFYAFLNVSRNASSDEITSAFRRLSKLYHPDKHYDEEKKKNAEILFNKVKKAYDVLIDGHKRAIYDTLGTKGLDTEGWTLIERHKTPQEIRDEYERLIKERDERRLQQRTNPKGTISVSINATDLFDHYHDDDEYEGFHFPHFEISSMSISQSIDAPLSTYDTLTLSGNLISSNGTGHGTVATSLRHVISAKTWTELEFAAGHGPVLALKGFRTLSKKSFANAHVLMHFSPAGIRPGLNVVMARHLDKHLVGYLTWKCGIQSSMSTLVVWDSRIAHIEGSIQLGIPNSFLSLRYHHKFENSETQLKTALKGGTFGLIVEYGIETKISQNSTIGASVSIGVPSGVTLKLKILRANQNYLFPILLSEEIIPNAIFYGSVTPILAYYCLKTFVIDPYNQREKDREKQKMRQTNSVKIAERRKEAELMISLMQEAYQRSVNRENEKKGLIIMRSIYGSESVINEFKDSLEMIPFTEEGYDVTVPLQCLVTSDSTIILTDVSKSQMPGFFDPCIGDDKKLFIRYKYMDKTHEITIDDEEKLKLPLEAHLVL